MEYLRFHGLAEDQTLTAFSTQWIALDGVLPLREKWCRKFSASCLKVKDRSCAARERPSARSGVGVVRARAAYDSIEHSQFDRKDKLDYIWYFKTIILLASSAYISVTYFTKSISNLVFPSPFLSKPFNNINQRDQHRHLNQRSNSRCQSLITIRPKSRDSHSNGQLKVIACGRETLRCR
jgi:hypothetical protein